MRTSGEVQQCRLAATLVIWEIIKFLSFYISLCVLGSLLVKAEIWLAMTSEDTRGENTIMNHLLKSRLYPELLWRRIEKRIKLPVLLAVIGMTLWICEMIVAIAVLQTRPIITL